jgi:hypothetical protein
VARARAGWWRASVADLADGTETTVGSIRVPASWGGLDLAARHSAMWVEFYAANAPGGMAAGEPVPYTRVRFGAPTAGVGPARAAARSRRPVMPTGSARARAPTPGSATTATGSYTRWASRPASSDPR